MTYQEELADIFENDKPEYSYTHCISADFDMGLGIAAFEDMDIHIICRTNDKRFASINFFN